MYKLMHYPNRYNNMENNMKGSYKAGLIILIISVLILAGFILPVADYVEKLLISIQKFGDWSVLLVGLLFIPACVFLVPGSILTMSTGFIASVHWPDNPVVAIFVAVGAVSLGSTIGATLAFLLGRTVARNWVQHHIDSNKKFIAFDKAINIGGFRLMLLIRMAPFLPFNLLNYALGLTGISKKDYILGSWLGMLPATFLFVYLGATAHELTELFVTGRTRTAAEYTLLLLGLLASIFMVILVSRHAQRVYKDIMVNQPYDSVPNSDNAKKNDFNQ